jgi:hypothetical protein
MSLVVVIGSPVLRIDGVTKAAGPGVSVAAAVARAGGTAELVGRIGDDAAGDALVLDLDRRGIGHAALLRVAGAATPLWGPRDPLSDEVPPAGLPLEPADLDLALRYLPDPAVVVVVDPLPPAALDVVVDGVAFAGARLLVLASSAGASLPPEVLVVNPPAVVDGAFALAVGRWAAATAASPTGAPSLEAVAEGVGWRRGGSEEADR